MIQGYTLTMFPKVTQYILCTTREETGKRILHNWWRISGHHILCTTREETGKRILHNWWIFYPAIQGKLNKDKEGRNVQPSKHRKRTTLSFV